MKREEFIDEEIERSNCHCELCNAETRDRVGQLWDVAVAAERERCAKIVEAQIQDRCASVPNHAACEYTCDDFTEIAARIRSGE